MGGFKWTWVIPCVGILMTLADFFYFKGLEDPEVLIVLISAIKRSQILFTVIIGGLLFKEVNKRKKIFPLIGVLLGVGCILYAR